MRHFEIVPTTVPFTSGLEKAAALGIAELEFSCASEARLVVLRCRGGDRLLLDTRKGVLFGVEPRWSRAEIEELIGEVSPLVSAAMEGECDVDVRPVAGDR